MRLFIFYLYSSSFICRNKGTSTWYLQKNLLTVNSTRNYHSSFRVRFTFLFVRPVLPSFRPPKPTCIRIPPLTGWRTLGNKRMDEKRRRRGSGLGVCPTETNVHVSRQWEQRNFCIEGVKCLSLQYRLLVIRRPLLPRRTSRRKSEFLILKTVHYWQES